MATILTALLRNRYLQKICVHRKGDLYWTKVQLYMGLSHH